MNDLNFVQFELEFNKYSAPALTPAEKEKERRSNINKGFVELAECSGLKLPGLKIGKERLLRNGI